jgi:hypothetical protein
MLTSAPILADRSRWHYLFPEGLQEVYPAKGGDVLTRYTPALCRKMVDTFNEACAIGRQFGMPAQPIPVQLQHVGVTNADVPAADKRRFGSCYALHYQPKGGTVPAGIWGLVEWTGEGWDLISTRQFNALSPTTVNRLRVASGRYLPGPALVEIGLVDVGFLEGIGTALDCLPADAFPYVGDRALEGVAALTEPPAAPRSYPDGFVLTRGAQHRSVTMDDEKVEIEMSAEKLTPALMEALGGAEAQSAIRAMCRQVMEDEFDGMANARGYMKREAVAAPSLGAAEDAANEAIALETRKKPAPTVDFEAIENARLNAEAGDLVKSGKLLAANASRFIARRKAGDDVSELVGDYTGWKATTGTPGRNAEPVTTRSAPKSVNAGEILQRIQNEGARTGRGPAENLKLYMAELDTLRSQGVTIVEA